MFASPFVSKCLKDLEKFHSKYPVDGVVQIDDEFRKGVEDICDELLNVKIEYTGLTRASQICCILNLSSLIMKRFINADVAEPLVIINFTVFMKLSQITTKLKTLIISELLDDNFTYKNDDYLFGYEKEQYICDTFKSKLKNFKTKSNESEIYKTQEYFKYFLIEYVRLLSKLKNKDVPLKKNTELLLEIADDDILAGNFHAISQFLPQKTKLCILQKITNCIAKPEFELHTFEFLKSKYKDYKLEICAVTFFMLQNVCEHLETGKMNQSSQMLSKFNVESIISLMDSPLNTSFKSTFEDSAKLITFKRYHNIIEVPSENIEKCLKVLELLSDLLRGHQKQMHNSPFALILLSILYEFVMATNLNYSVIMKLIRIINEFLKICGLPKNFLAVSFAYDIYQKLKSDKELEPNLIDLFKSISNRLDKTCLIDDMEKLNNVEQNWVDKTIIISCFLDNIAESHSIPDTYLIDWHYALNENVILASKYMCSQKHLLVNPYCVSLHFSIVNKNEDCLFNNLAILDDYITILFDENVKTKLEDKRILLSTILKHYEVIACCIPKGFIIKYWVNLLNDLNMDDKNAKLLLNVCSEDDLVEMISSLKIETSKIIERNEPAIIHQDYYKYILEIWSFFLNIPWNNHKKEIRKHHINHFCFILNKTILFDTKKIQTEQGLIFLLKLVCLLLQIPWINHATLMSCSFRIMTIIEKPKRTTSAQLLIEASELLIILYKCPNNSIKPYLGLYITTFTNFLKKCMLSGCPVWPKASAVNELYYIPFHKLEKCSSLFKHNKVDFDIICRYMIEDLISLAPLNNNLYSGARRHFSNVIFNFMDVCSADEMKKLLSNIQGPSLLVLKNAYEEYKSSVRFTGRL